MADVQIRPARPDDRDFILQVLTLFQDEERTMHANRRPGAEVAEMYLAEIERDNATHNGTIMIAEHGGAAAGLVACHDDRDDDQTIYDEARDHGYVSDIFVLSDHRGHGVGGALLDAAEAYLAKRGFKRVRLWVLAANHNARAVYEGRGYEPYETIYEKKLATRESQ